MQGTPCQGPPGENRTLPGGLWWKRTNLGAQHRAGNGVRRDKGCKQEKACKRAVVNLNAGCALLSECLL